MGLGAALYAGLSGLNVNQTEMNVVGNNIANVNTTAFKSSRAIFSSQFYVTDAAGSPADGNYGGSNPEQRGLGAQVASISQNFTQGQLQTTGNATDMAINGNGFFVTENSSKGQLFTRDGSFTLNGDHQLVTTSGAYVEGYSATDGVVNTTSLGRLSIPIGSDTIAKATSTASLSGNLAADGAPASGASVLDTQDLTTVGATAAPTGATPLTSLVTAGTTTPAFTSGQVLNFTPQRAGSNLSAGTLTVTPTTTVADLQNFINNTTGIDTSVAGAGTNVIPGKTANSIELQITGNSGTANALSAGTGAFSDAVGNTPLTLTADATNNPAGESVATTMTVYDSLGNPVNVNLTTVLQSTSDTGSTWKFYATSGDNKDPANPGGTLVGTGTLTFNSSGVLQSVTGGDLSIHRAGTGASPVLPVNLDFTGVSALAQDTAHTGSEMQMSSQDGIQLGTLTSFAVGSDGTITGTFDNGQTRALGQVAIATFNNPQGLDDVGNNNYATGANSGVAVITKAATLGAGTIQSGALEQSNVDLSSEFTNMIIASTGFSAASKVITTSDQMLTDLLNTQR
jgi:flagellar hook protein FlgE